MTRTICQIFALSLLLLGCTSAFKSKKSESSSCSDCKEGPLAPEEPPEGQSEDVDPGTNIPDPLEVNMQLSAPDALAALSCVAVELGFSEKASQSFELPDQIIIASHDFISAFATLDDCRSNNPTENILVTGDKVEFVVLSSKSGSQTISLTGSGTSANLIPYSQALNFVTLDELTAIPAGLNGPYGLTLTDTGLAVIDTYQHRVLLWNSLPAGNDDPPKIVIGQSDFSGTLGNGGLAISAMGLLGVASASYHDGKLLIGDTDNHRILIWDSIPTDNNQPANLVVGQPDMATGVANDGGISATSMRYPFHASIADNKLIVSDTGNSRVLIWNTVPSSPNTPADVVLGQATMNTNAAGISASALDYPYRSIVVDDKLIVADFRNNRVLIWNAIPSANATPANVVIGQPDFATKTANTGGLSSQSLSGPGSVSYDGKRLYIADSGNHRILGFDQIPQSDHAAADVVVGQEDFNTALSDELLNTPLDVTSDGRRLFIADNANNRVIIIKAP